MIRTAIQPPYPPRSRSEQAFTLVEAVVVLAILGILTAFLGHSIASSYSGPGRVKSSAASLVEGFVELRAQAIAGVRGACMDFPNDSEFRLFRDANSNQIWDAGEIEEKRPFHGDVAVWEIRGGKGSFHAVCFRSSGIVGAGTTALEITLGTGNYQRKLQFLPSTGRAKIL